MRYIFSVIITMFLVLPASVFAETKEMIAEGEYIMGDGETMAIAEERAQKEADRHAAEEAGAFVKSYTKVKNMALQEDVIEVIANHSMKITVLEKKRTMVGDAVNFYCKIKAVVTTEEIEANLEKIAQDRGIVETYNKLKTEYDRQAKEMEKLKKELAEAKGEDEKVVLGKIAAEENLFKANLLFEKGMEAVKYYFEYEDAIEAFTGAIALNPIFADAYAARGGAYSEIRQFRKAIEDINKAIEIQPENPVFYAVRAMIYPGCSDSYRNLCKAGAEEDMVGDMKCREISPDDCNRALNDIGKAIQLKPENSFYYIMRAGLYREAEMDDKAIEEYSKVIAMLANLSEEWPISLVMAYLSKAELAKEKGDKHAAVADLTSAITVVTNSKYYNEKLRKLSNILRKARDKEYTYQQMEAVLKKEYNIDPKNEKELERLRERLRGQGENLEFVSGLYIKRSDIYRDMGSKEKTDRDIKTACELFWFEETCKDLEKDTKKSTRKPSKKKR